ncbi:MAG: acetate--CoA ligase family protein [Deltaproteobacteria bacterium]|nr:acetate--CoA ligase family protein [Deltaproteobacteria bacterium]
MLNPEIKDIFLKAQKTGWVMEPEAKRLMALAGIPVPAFSWVKTESGALKAARNMGYPVAAKVVSPEILHKTEVGGVALGIKNDTQLSQVFSRFSTMPGFEGILVEEMVSGTELILGAKIDDQFGPVILLGIGGTGVEVYGDTALRMAPLGEKDVVAMFDSLKGAALLKGHRGTPPMNLSALMRLMLDFSALVMACAEHIESIDLNPVKCTPEKCVAADARILLPQAEK